MASLYSVIYAQTPVSGPFYIRRASDGAPEKLLVPAATLCVETKALTMLVSSIKEKDIRRFLSDNLYL